MKEKFKIVGIIALAAIFALSFMSCDEPVEDPCEDGHDWDVWVVEGETSAKRMCLECGEEETLAPKHFEGSWKATLTNSTQTVTLSASEFKIVSSVAAADSFTLSSASWEAQANGTQHAASKTAFPVGFAITGTAAITGTSGTGGASLFANNTSAGVYINSDSSKIVIRLTAVYMPNSNEAMREYVFEKAN